MSATADDFPRTRAVAARLEVLAHAGSTNAELAQRASAAPGDYPHLSVVLTDDQRAGRGRLDRTWTAPAGAALAISVLADVAAVPAADRGWIPLIAGLAMTEAVAEQLAGRDVTLKWPNDVLVEGGKICGILAEVLSPDAVIIGAGVNTAMTAAQLPVPTATSFALAGAAADADRLVAGFLERLDARLSALAAGAKASVVTAVTARCGTIGRDVTVSLPGSCGPGEPGPVLRGHATGLDADGRLVVDVDGHPHAVSAGDVVHVR